MDKSDLHMYDLYQDYYAAVENSAVYHRYFSRVYGADFSQDGFSDVDDIDEIIRIASINESSDVLDIGCGNGRMCEYIHDKTGASVCGYDYSDTAIRNARERTAAKNEQLRTTDRNDHLRTSAINEQLYAADINDHMRTSAKNGQLRAAGIGVNLRATDKADKNARLRFDVCLIGEADYPDSSFNVALSVDTMYFTDDAEKVIAQTLRSLKPGGVFIVMYSAFSFSEPDTSADGTGFAKAAANAGVKYETLDFTRNFYALMKRKRAAAVDMAPEFEAEGLARFRDRIITESIDVETKYEDFIKNNRRYMYIIRK